MAAFDFPNSPSNGDTYSANGIDWIYNGNVWKKDCLLYTSDAADD